MPRRFRIPAFALAAVVATVVALLPPAARHTEPPPPSTVRGAFHVHSNRSDGSGSVDEIAAAAGRAGLQFIILTDHGDATREPDPPAYRGGVLTIDGIELNTTGGHYAAFGLPASPYPIAGTPADVDRRCSPARRVRHSPRTQVRLGRLSAGRTGSRRSMASSG